MASHHARSAGFGFGHGNGVRPRPERNLLADMLCLAAGMRIVASNTVSALLHVDMIKVQIVFAIPEIGQGAGEFILGDFLVMAAEAQIIILRAVFLVKLFGIIPHKHAAEFGAMHLMAGHAITGLNRAMLRFAAYDSIAQLIMAGKTHLCRVVFQQSFLVGRMSPVAFRTLALINGGVFKGGGFNVAVYGRTQLLMAFSAKRAAFFVQLESGIGAVRIMTLVAVFIHRFMDVLHAEFIFPFLMALKTKLRLFRRSNQQVFVLAGMGPVTGDTIPRADWPMAVGFGKDRRRMTVEAQAADA